MELAPQLASETKAFDLVISDYRMPDLDGVAFLTDFRYRQPDCIRIILSGMTAQLHRLLLAARAPVVVSGGAKEALTIEAKNLGYAYGPEGFAFRNVNLEIRPEESVAHHPGHATLGPRANLAARGGL